MQSIDSIPVRLRFLILLIMIIAFSSISGLTSLHTINSISELRQSDKDLHVYFNEIQSLDHQLNVLAVSLDDTTADHNDEFLKYNDFSKSCISLLRDLEQRPSIYSDSVSLMRLESIIERITALNKEILSLSTASPAMQKNLPLERLHTDYIDDIYASGSALREGIVSSGLLKQKKHLINLLVILFLSILFFTLLIIIYSLTINKNLSLLQDFIIKLEKGGRPNDLSLASNSEFQNISSSLNRFLARQDKKIAYLKTIGEGEMTGDFAPDEDDILGQEIKIMTDRIKSAQSKEKKQQEEKSNQSWTSDGIAQFAEILRSERENVIELSFKIIQKLVTYLNVEMGTIFLTEDSEDNEKRLLSIASYAYDRRKYIDKSFLFGEGLPGTCALEKEKIYIDEIPEDYTDVISGVGQSKPRFVLLVPLQVENEIFGIIELAAFKGLKEHELNFVDELAESIASTLMAVKTNEKTAELLKQSQEQALQLKQQEEAMRKSLGELQKAQDESRKKESELTGLLNAMNESSLVAEYGINGRFIHINEKFLKLLESPIEQILGKHHHEFSQADHYSEEYKAFWEALKNNEVISKVENFRLFSGREIWLQQTYTPILNDEGNVYKILNIAVDISRSIEQQKSLENQAGEIIRKSLEMESLNEAVNSSIIKCDLDSEGVLIDLNDNFSLITGYKRNEVLGRNYRLFLKDVEKEQFEKIWSEVLKDKTYEGAIRRTKPTGEEVWLMSTFSPVKDESGEIYKIYFLALDITEKRLKYQLLEEANREIERLRKELNKQLG